MNNRMNVVKCCEVVDQLCEDAGKMANALKRLLGESIKDFSEEYKPAGDWIRSDQGSAHGWMYKGEAGSFPIMEKNKRKKDPAGWLSYQIILYGDGIPLVEGPVDGEMLPYEPTLHISFWRYDIYFKGGYNISFPMKKDWPLPEIKDERLLYWEKSEESEINEWTFSLRLLDMDSENTLQKSVIAPIVALLLRKEVKEALPDDLKGLIRYKDKILDSGDKTVVVVPAGLKTDPL